MNSYFFFFFFYLINIKHFFHNQVPPAELEGVLRTHPAVLDAAVIGVPDVRTGEAPLAYVVLDPERPPTSEEEVKKYVAERVAPYKQVSAGVRFVGSLPKSAAGKLLRRELKDEYMKNTSKWWQEVPEIGGRQWYYSLYITRHCSDGFPNTVIIPPSFGSTTTYIIKYAYYYYDDSKPNRSNKYYIFYIYNFFIF